MGANTLSDYTVLELAGQDRRGILSEISAVLTSLKCNVVAAESWTHNERLACVVYITDQGTNGRIEDSRRLSLIKEQVGNILRANDDIGEVLMEFSNKSLVHKERRLHQIMLADRDYQSTENIEKKLVVTSEKPSITIENCKEKGYSIVNIGCKDRPKLLFDIVCTLTDMQYAVFHASIRSDGHQAFQVHIMELYVCLFHVAEFIACMTFSHMCMVNAYIQLIHSLRMQEYFIRHVDGYALDSQCESQCVIKCLEAAIERRVSEVIYIYIYI